jgi:DNA-binding PadR family transcriptional regulator
MSPPPVNRATHEPGLATPAYVVLGMIFIGARTGYEVKQMVEQSTRFFWTISQAQIYPSLQQLEQAGFITGREDPQGRRRRRVFEITAAGRAELTGWLGRDDPMPFELRDTGMLKLFFADTLGHDQALALLHAVRRRSEDRAGLLRALEPVARAVEEQGYRYPLLTLELGIAVHQAMADVCAAFERRQPAEPPS